MTELFVALNVLPVVAWAAWKAGARIRRYRIRKATSIAGWRKPVGSGRDSSLAPKRGGSHG